MVTTMAASQAYVSDCADPTSRYVPLLSVLINPTDAIAYRARTLSLFYGMWFSGMAIGPTRTCISSLR